MPLRVRFLRSFDASFDVLSGQERSAVRRAMARLLDYFSGGPRGQGLGLRKLRGNYWEIRASVDKRALFLLDRGLLTFVMAGNHDEIRRQIK